VHEEVDHVAARREREDVKVALDVEGPGKKYPVFDPNHRRLILPDA
jgi:hypothetical protein